MIELHTFGPIDLGALNDAGGGVARADLELYGIDHFRPSYTALVFFNDAAVTTANAEPETQKLRRQLLDLRPRRVPRRRGPLRRPRRDAPLRQRAPRTRSRAPSSACS